STSNTTGSSNNVPSSNGSGAATNAPNGSPQNIAPANPNTSHSSAIVSDTINSKVARKRSHSNVESKSANAAATLHRNIAERSYSASSPILKKSSEAKHSNRTPQAQSNSSINSAKIPEKVATPSIPPVVQNVNSDVSNVPT